MTYELRVNFSDGTYSVESVDATSIKDATEFALRMFLQSESVQVLCCIDRARQAFLAW